MIEDLNQKIVFLVDEGREEEVVTRLSRVGYDHTLGYLKGGFEAWMKSGETVEKMPQVDADELSDIWKKNSPNILDVRKESEFESEHVQCISPLKGWRF